MRVKNKDVVRLYHHATDSFLLSHDVASPLTSTNEEFTTWPSNTTEDRKHEQLFEINVLGASDGEEMKSLASHFRLVHVDTSVSMYMSGKTLPSWGFNRLEVNGKKDNTDQGATWYVDEILQHPDDKSDRTSKEESRQVKSMNFFKKFFELVSSIFYK